MAGRDPVAEILAYNAPLLAHAVEPAEGKRDLTREALSRKLDALCGEPFRFFRGTFHLMARDLFEARVPHAAPHAPEGLAVGDLHLENFGVYRGQSGGLTFDVNDFDDVGWAPLDLDLKRLCTSALLLPGLPAGARAAAARAIADAWAEETQKLGGRFPVRAWTEEKAREPVSSLLAAKTRDGEWLAKSVAHGKLVQNDRQVRPAKRWVALVEKAVATYLDDLRQLKAPGVPAKADLLDVAYRFRGTGSLGRLRFTALIDDGGVQRLFELKEARSSAMDDARGRPGDADRGRVQTAAIRRLQGDPWPRVAATTLGGVSALGRENEPEEEKLDAASFVKGDARHAALESYADQCGRVLARLHCRENAPLMLGARWDVRQAAREAVVFAESYAEQVERDQRAFAAARDRAAREWQV